jgi:hypothetical protein
MQVLCKSLTYRQGRPEMLTGQPISLGISLYQPPFEEFQVLRVSVDQPGSICIPAQQSPMILLGLETAGAHGLQVDSPAAPLSSWACTIMCRDGCPSFLPRTACMLLLRIIHQHFFKWMLWGAFSGCMFQGVLFHVVHANLSKWRCSLCTCCTGYSYL